MYLAGVLTSCKAAISEVSDDSNQALGITIVGAAWGMGYIVGPAVSGALADPIGQYHLNITSKLVPNSPFIFHLIFFPHHIQDGFFQSFLTKFPYALPSCFSFLLFMVSFLVTIFCLPETLAKKR